MAMWRSTWRASLPKPPDELRRTDIACACARGSRGKPHPRNSRGRARPAATGEVQRQGAAAISLSLRTCDTTIDSRDVVQDDFYAGQSTGPGTDRKAGAAPHIFAAGFGPSRGGAHSGSACRPLPSGDRAGVGDDRLRPTASSAVENIDCGLVFRSVGRRTAPLDGIPYDDVRGVHANIDGRVGDWLLYRRQVSMSADGASVVPAAPSAPTAGCGMATAEAILADLPARAGQRTGDPRHAAGASSKHAGCARPEFCRLGGHRRRLRSAAARRSASRGKNSCRWPDMLAAADASSAWGGGLLSGT